MTWILIVIAVGVVVALIANSLLARSKSKEMDKKIVDSGAIDAFSALHVEGLGISNKASCDLYLFADKLLIDSTGRKFEIPTSRIRAAEFKSEKELYEKSKSVVGRALIGTLLVPGLGTIVGGMSGIGSKKVKGQSNYYLILNFVDANGQLNGVTFLNNLNTIRLVKFRDKINHQLSTSEQDITIL